MKTLSQSALQKPSSRGTSQLSHLLKPIVKTQCSSALTIVNKLHEKKKKPQITLLSAIKKHPSNQRTILLFSLFL